MGERGGGTEGGGKRDGRRSLGKLGRGEGRGSEGGEVRTQKHALCELCSDPLLPSSLLSFLLPLLLSSFLPTYLAITIYSLVSAALGSQIKVADRPVTQQGLGGMKTGARGRNDSFSPLIFVYILCLK